MDPIFELVLGVKAGERTFQRMAEESFRPLGVTNAQADALTVLAQSGPLSLKELGGLLIAEAGHPSRLVDRLVEAGWVERRPAERDRRRVVLSLTPEGRRLAKEVEKARKQMLDFGRMVVGDRDLDTILEMLRHMLSVTPYGELLERRRALTEGKPGKSGQAPPGA